MLFLLNSDNNAPFFDSILFREDALFTFSVSYAVHLNICKTHSYTSTVRP